MSFVDELLLKIKRGETPLSRAVRGAILGILRANAPVPSLVLPLLRLVYEGYYTGVTLWRTMWSYFLWQPLFRSRCRRAGKRLRIHALPFVGGHVEIDIGDDVEFGGKVDILSGRFLDRPRLIIKDRAGIGAGTLISVNQEVVIEEDVTISTGCRISDNDGHPREADLRAQGAPLSPRDIKPVRICRSAWIGRDCHIMKGVTIGEGAIVGVNSVVISDVPPYSLAMGNPAEVYFSNVGRPASQAAAHRTKTAPQE
jgi:acetyltransferase-like isoleucine patch superfamily enzyme